MLNPAPVVGSARDGVCFAHAPAWHAVPWWGRAIRHDSVVGHVASRDDDRGDVVAVHSHWTSDGSRIVTDATIRPPEGADVVVRQAGGSVDGIGMITMPGPVLLELGMTVAVAAHRDFDLAQHEHVVVDSVKVSAYPPDYVRSFTEHGRPYYWQSGCAFVTIDAAGTTALPDDQVVSIVDASMATWNNDTATCSYLKLRGDGRKALEVDCKDYVNLIKFRDTVWAARRSVMIL